MSTTLTLTPFPGGYDWQGVATSTLADPTYRWRKNGELVATTKCNVMMFHLDSGEDMEISVFDDDTVPDESFPSRDRFQWLHADGADYYEISEYVDSAWVVTAVIRDIGQWIFAWQTRVLEDCVGHQFRIRSMGMYADGSYKTFTSYMIRRPDHPQYTPVIDADTGVLSFV